MLKVISLILVTVLFIGCKKDKEIIPVTPALIQETSLKFNFKALFNNKQLVFNSNKLNTNFAGDSLNVSLFNYYISHIVLKKNDGTSFIEPESYHFIKHDDSSKTSFIIKNLPEGTYTEIEFLIGVDSIRNVSGSQTGALDVSNGMFWDWNTGYIFFKIEGVYKTNTQLTLNDFIMHVGGFSYPGNNIKKCAFNLLNTPIEVKKEKTQMIYINASVDEIFINPSTISLDLFNAISGSKKATTIANNYADMFTIDKIVN